MVKIQFLVDRKVLTFFGGVVEKNLCDIIL